MHKIYKQKGEMKKKIEELTEKNTNPSEKLSPKKDNPTMKDKSAKIAELTKKNKDLVDQLADAQTKANKGDDTRVSKLSKVVGEKNEECRELMEENKKLKTSNEELQKQMNEISSKVSSLETSKKRLENQVDNLIEAVGKPSNKKETVANGRENKVDEVIQPSGKRSSEEREQSKSVKCRHNDRGSCNRGESCHFFHSKTQCKMFSKFNECENQKTCMKRHPIGICSRWRKGRCDRDLECHFRHPVDAFDSVSNNQKSPERKEEREPRKRRLSSQQEDPNKAAKLASKNEQENHFLLEKCKELQQQVDSFQMQKEIIPKGWMN